MSSPPSSTFVVTPQRAGSEPPDVSGESVSELRGDSGHPIAEPHIRRGEFERPSQGVAELESGAASPAPQAGPHPPVELDQIAEYLQGQSRELQRREQLLHAQLAQFDQERRAFRLAADQQGLEIAQQVAALEADRAAVDQRLESAAALEAELQDLREGLLRERHALQAEREEFRSQSESERREFESACHLERRKLEQQREDVEADVARIRDELKQEQVLVESRHRFQQEHLQRTMREFEHQQLEFRREQQQSRMRSQETESQMILRNQQLDRIRKLLIERQHSVERERHWLQVERRAIEGRIRDDREELRALRAEWEQERDAQKADLRRQQDLLALHAENLEARRQRLDGLRVELEETNRQTLEMRLAVEEAYSQLTQTVGAEVTRARVEEARQILIESYRHTRESLFTQRQELEQLQVKLQQQRQEFLDERQQLAEWVSRQEEQLAQREREALEERARIESREQAWRDASEQWHREKLEAETVIRDLLCQLDEQQAN